MGIEEKLCELGEKLSQGVRVKDVRIGLGYTAVQVNGGEVGLAYTFRKETGHTCTALKIAGELSGTQAAHLVSYIKERDVISSAVGLATLNALFQKRMPASLGEDFFPLIGLKAGDLVGMVGYFAPIIPIIRKSNSKLIIFEKNIKRGEGLYGPKEIPAKLPDCSVVILSATTLINHTFEGIVSHVKRAREVVLLGPSTPMIPDIMGTYGITILAGMRIVKPAMVLRIVSEGGGTQRLRDSVVKTVVKCGK